MIIHSYAKNCIIATEMLAFSELILYNYTF
jgi:hypothetical protein